MPDLADDKPPVGKGSAKKEPAFEKLPNLSRVTPAQLQYISFPSDARYQPVRAVSSKPLSVRSAKMSRLLGTSAEKYAGGGGILILTDLRPEEEAEFIDATPEPIIVEQPAASTSATDNTAAMPTGRHIALDESMPEADPPGSFEVCCFILIESLN